MERKVGKFRYAKDCEGRTILITDVDKVKKKDTYTCVGCGGEMVARQGEKNAWHFAHKKEECSYETYLHILAKTKIYEWLRDAEEVKLIVEQSSLCKEYDNCFFKNEMDCKRSEPKSYNLKDYYDVCTLEERVQVGNKYFVPDILLKSTDINRSSLWIEIEVTHACEMEKIQTGFRIIEFKIDSEDDIAQIVSRPIERREGVTYYNFSDEQKERTDRLERRLAQVNLTKLGYTKYIDSSCEELDFRDPNTIANLLYPYELSNSFRNKGIVPILVSLSDKSCSSCKHSITHFLWGICCQLYGHFTDKDEAERCKDYVLNISVFDECIKKLERRCRLAGIKLWINDAWYRSLSD